MLKKLLALACLTLSIGANSANLVISGGQLMGATDVDVGGKFYDVSFLNGSCNSLYSGCSNFTFNTIDAAALASQALLDQVFIGVYDDEPGLTNGIDGIAVAFVMTPARRQSPPLSDFQWIGKSAVNWCTGTGCPEDEVTDAQGELAMDFTLAPSFTYAVWSRTVVPLPAAAWLFISAIAVLAGGKRISCSMRSV